jgi:hypothetical protein
MQGADWYLRKACVCDEEAQNTRDPRQGRLFRALVRDFLLKAEAARRLHTTVATNIDAPHLESPASVCEDAAPATAPVSRSDLGRGSTADTVSAFG